MGPKKSPNFWSRIRDKYVVGGRVIAYVVVVRGPVKIQNFSIVEVFFLE